MGDILNNIYRGIYECQKTSNKTQRSVSSLIFVGTLVVLHLYNQAKGQDRQIKDLQKRITELENLKGD